MPIFDQGYQHWSGELGGRLRRLWAITRGGVRAGRKNPLLRITLLGAWAPALALAGFLCVWGLLERKSSAIAGLMPMLNAFLNFNIIADPKHYRVEVWTLAYYYFLRTELYLSMILILLVGPQLISKDLRFNALPLYFSRPLRRLDYFVGKLGVILWFLALVVIFPSVVAFVLGLACTLDITVVRDAFPILLRAIVFGLTVTASAGLLVLAMSSLTRNSRYVALFWVGIWLVSSITAASLDTALQSQREYAQRREMARRFESQRRGPSNSKGRPMMPAPNMGNMGVTEENVIQDAAGDWRPLFSYTANLLRVGNQVLGTNDAWESVSKLLPEGQQGFFLVAQEGDTYPWKWSAFVLGGLCLVSVLILNTRVKSLDRLR